MGWGSLAIVASYLLVILAVGWWKGRREESLDSYLVGDRRVPWWAVLGSLIATEVSAATYLAVPAVGFSENLGYLQFGIGSFLARIFVATVFMGVFYQARCFSIYEYLGQRFGGTSQFTAAVYFLVTRLLASGVRLMIAVTGVAVITGWPFSWCLLLFGFVTVLYTAFGGIKAVIWTDCVQAVVFLSAGLCGLGWLVLQLGPDLLVEQARTAGRLEFIQWLPRKELGWINDPNWLITAVLFGFVSTVAAYSTDQDMVQRLLASRSGPLARRSLIISGFMALPVAGLFLCLGVALFVWFQQNPAENFPMREAAGELIPDADRVMAFFITTEIPFWLQGLLLAGVLAAAMSSLDSAMAAMSASAVRDILAPLRKQPLGAGAWVMWSRLCTVGFASALLATAWMLRDGGGFLWLAFKITSLTYGSLLGVFLLGRWTSRGSDRGNLLAMLLGTTLSAVGLWLIETGALLLAWTWLLLLGTLSTIFIGALFKGPAAKVRNA